MNQYIYFSHNSQETGRFHAVSDSKAMESMRVLFGASWREMYNLCLLTPL